MFKNYLRVALRNVKKQKAYAFINIAGFAVGMAACIMIMMYVLSELSYDKFHENADRIYRIGVEGNLSGSFVKYPLSNLGTGPAMLKDFPEVESFTRVYPMDRITVKYEDKNFYEEGGIYTDPHFFTVFSFPLVAGDPQTALTNAYSIVITSDMAKKYFGDDNPIGKQLRLNNRDDYTVTGVMKNLPGNSHLTFDFLTSIETFYITQNHDVEEWNNFNNYTYLLLREQVDPEKFAEKFPAFLDRYLANMRKLLGEDLNFFLQPLTDIHLHSNLGYEMPGNSDIAFVYIFSSIAFFIFLIACINFMNLATARSASREKEVGLRKVLGANKNNLIRQFLAESLLYGVVSFLLALVLVRLALPFFNTLSGNDFIFPLSNMPYLIPAFVAFVLLTGLLAGSYPAFFLYAFQPVNVLKGSLKTGAASSRFRSILVVFQFVISIALITGTSVMLNQLDYMKKKNLGFDKEHVAVIPIKEDSIKKNLVSIKNELKSHSSIVDVSSASDVPGNYPDYSVFVPEGYTMEETRLMHRINCDAEFIPAMGMEILSGRNFSSEYATDPEDAVIINETAAQKYGWDDPIGKKIGFFTDEDMLQTRPKMVIGVLKDFHAKSLHDKILPLLLTNNKDYHEEIVVRIKTGEISAALDFLKEKWREYDPNRPFDYYFLDQHFDAQYRNDERLNKIIGYFTILAIFVACLGLYGMASFMAEQRFKEIGIRKTLGASLSGIVILLNKEITKLILIANVIAIPIAYYALQRWLETFAYRTEINLFTFVLSAAVVIVIGYVTVAYQSVKAALTNPVEVIRME